MKGMLKEEFDNDLFGFNLCSEPTQTDLICVRRHPKRELLPEFLGKLSSQSDRSLVVKLIVRLHQTYRVAQFVLWKTLHPDEEPATVPFTAAPSLDVRIDLFPTSQIEVPDTEVGSVRYFNGL